MFAYTYEEHMKLLDRKICFYWYCHSCKHVPAEYRWNFMDCFSFCVCWEDICYSCIKHSPALIAHACLEPVRIGEVCHSGYSIITRTASIQFFLPIIYSLLHFEEKTWKQQLFLSRHLVPSCALICENGLFILEPMSIFLLSMLCFA